MSNEQRQYIQAKALYETAIAGWNAAAEARGIYDGDEATYLAICADLDAEYDTTAAYDLLAAAERQLVAWAHTVIQTERAYKAQRALLVNLFAEAERNITIRAKVADLAMRLAA